MDLKEIVAFWCQQRRKKGRWVHPADDAVFDASQHTFNLEFPVSPYVGDILNARVIILGANAGYSPDVTPSEFPDEKTIQGYVSRVCAPSESDWSFVSSYYENVNYGSLIASGRAVLINACPYRSVKISAEPENQRTLKRLPSTTFNRRWLLDAVIPMAQAEQRLIVAKRPGLWQLPTSARQTRGVVFDPAPISPQITSSAWSVVREWLDKEF